MRTGRPKKSLVLSQEEREKLEQWARRPKTAQRLALRSRVVLGCADGLSNQTVARSRYAHLAPGYLAEAVEKLATTIPPTEETQTDTAIDTEVFELSAAER